MKNTLRLSGWLRTTDDNYSTAPDRQSRHNGDRRVNGRHAGNATDDTMSTRFAGSGLALRLPGDTALSLSRTLILAGRIHPTTIRLAVGMNTPQTHKVLSSNRGAWWTTKADDEHLPGRCRQAAGALVEVPEIDRIEAEASRVRDRDALPRARNRDFRGNPAVRFVTERPGVAPWSRRQEVGGVQRHDPCVRPPSRRRHPEQPGPMFCPRFRKGIDSTPRSSVRSHQRIAVLRESRSDQRPDPRAP